MIDPTFVSVKELSKKNNISDDVFLFQNFPNPAAITTRIKFTVTNKSFVSLHLSNIVGKEIQSYVNKVLDPGNYEINVDLEKLKPGTYNYRINNTSFKLIKN